MCFIPDARMDSKDSDVKAKTSLTEAVCIGQWLFSVLSDILPHIIANL